jgi:kynureninase
VIELDDLRRSPSPLSRHYSRFRVADRLLLTGHSHQAWPDIAMEGQLRAFEDAAEAVDAKWERAFAKAERVRAGFHALLDDPSAELALAEEGVELVRVPASPAGTLAARCADAVDHRTAAVLVSAVLFETARIVPGLDQLAAACQHDGAELLVDAYHALGVVPFSLPVSGLGDAWVVGGGYKYLQLGEGNCFLRLPAHADRLRPVITGWFAEFAALADDHQSEQVGYGHGGARFAGSTYDPTSHYRAASVFEFFDAHGLTPARLRRVSRHQVELLANRFDELGIPDDVVTRDRRTPLDAFGGFLALRSRYATVLQQALAARGVSTDSRGAFLRFGPAPYLSDAQLDEAMAALGETAKDVAQNAT